MSATRRILAAGLPSVAVAAALAFSASPALAVAEYAARPAVTATPCADDDRTKCDYGSDTGEAPATGGPTRGHAGYGTTTPSHTVTPSPSATTPSGNVDTVPPTTPPGVQDTVTPTPTSSTGGGVSPAHTLPVTGAPMGAIVSLGALMVAGGVASVWYTRRRRNA
ncbi:LPXTG cell wall anchor domain-containing protein [Paractinoplanes toevensis]|uniref:Gram-positive cocci surface proteins LPxTG domain-containing protein n=1 Tax=Paractinoplanes toevensis TaxID=571911 RepID=A0A919VZT1_9ACTN|nr:LPXTG cell wall anchor domain-containing protein [Actinoplanes toevensis]GIM90482.1 hypothetical protein Ato02nite_022750 [Actinoplanes toevensis]